MHTNCFCNLQDIYKVPGLGKVEATLSLLCCALFSSGWTQKNCKMYLRNFHFVFFLFLFTNIVHVYITNSPSHTDNYVYFSSREGRKKNSSDFAQSLDSKRVWKLCTLQAGRTTKQTKENSFMKYFWINCLVLLFAKYNNKWLIMDGIFFLIDIKGNCGEKKGMCGWV